MRLQVIIRQNNYRSIILVVYYYYLLLFRSKSQAEQSILDRIQRRQLKWYGHLLRMEDCPWPKKIYQWTPHGRMRRGKPQQPSDGLEAETWKKRDIFGVWEWTDGS